MYRPVKSIPQSEVCETLFRPHKAKNSPLQHCTVPIIPIGKSKIYISGFNAIAIVDGPVKFPESFL